MLSKTQSQFQEKVIEESKEELAEEVEVEFDKEKLNILIQNGVPELSAKHSLLNTNNNVDDALMWFYSNIDNPIINTPIPKQNRKNSNIKTNCNQESLMLIESMGFSNKQAEGSLIKFNNDLEQALNHLMNNPDDTFESNKTEISSNYIEKDINKNNSSVFDLYGK